MTNTYEILSINQDLFVFIHLLFKFDLEYNLFFQPNILRFIVQKDKKSFLIIQSVNCIVKIIFTIIILIKNLFQAHDYKC